MQGVSVVICCHNSAGRIEKTLRHLAAQDAPPELVWEVVVVDNASSDGTVEVATATWREAGSSIPLRVVSERQLGIMHARRRGAQAARYDLISFVDDDNWVDPSWVRVVTRIFRDHPNVGACGGQNAPLFAGKAPTWFAQLAGMFATGPQADHSGYVGAHGEFLMGAGLSVRRDTWQSVMGRVPELSVTGRRGGALLCGDDEEICCRLRLAGWRLWYEEELRLEHYLPSTRLTWAYVRRLYRGVGQSRVSLDPYRRVLRERRLIDADVPSDSWSIELGLGVLRWLRWWSRVLWEGRFPPEGDPRVLWLDLISGRIHGLLRERGRYRGAAEALRNAFPEQVPPAGRGAEGAAKRTIP
jgi:glycosyltransferase involved in cell wall biosynthesis